MNKKHLPAWFLGLILLFAATACGSSGNDSIAQGAVAATPGVSGLPQPGPTNDPNTEAGARAQAQADWSAYAAGDYAGVWDAFTKADKTIITRDAYVMAVEGCFGSNGPILSAKVTSSRAEGKDFVVVIDAGIGSAARTYTYENGQWKERMTEELKKTLKAVDGSGQLWLQKMRADGTCTQ